MSNNARKDYNDMRRNPRGHPVMTGRPRGNTECQPVFTWLGPYNT